MSSENIISLTTALFVVLITLIIILSENGQKRIMFRAFILKPSTKSGKMPVTPVVLRITLDYSK